MVDIILQKVDNILPMPENPNKSNKKEEDLTIKEASNKLDISEATVKKYIKDFDLDVKKGSGSKVVISNEVFQALSEIAKLRANGLTIQEIKELKSQKPSKNIMEEIDETVVEEKEEDKGLLMEVVPEQSSDSSINGNGTLLEQGELEKELSLDITSLDEKDADSEAEKLEEEVQEGEGSQEQRRKRGFNYRYVERQIANDSKRVHSLRQRLKNPNLSVRDRLFFEEALERRILFLNGWKHILRWISSK